MEEAGRGAGRRQLQQGVPAAGDACAVDNSHTVHTLYTPAQVEATVAEGQHGDIAIDDVSLTPGCR